tara:strand:+ start:978 stop:1277 length:300 start_codon:yes stop_codon:yes gene_type:complete
MVNAWRQHIKDTMAGNPELKAKEGLKGILKLASKTYKKTAKAVEGAVKPVHKKHTRRHHKRGSKHHKGKTAKHHRKRSGKKHHKKSSKKKTAKRRRRKH